MLHSYYKGSGNALILEGDTLSVVNQSADEPGVPMAHPRHVGRRPADLGADELQELLIQGDIVSIQSEGGTTSFGKSTVAMVLFSFCRITVLTKLNARQRVRGRVHIAQ